MSSHIRPICICTQFITRLIPNEGGDMRGGYDVGNSSSSSTLPKTPPRMRQMQSQGWNPVWGVCIYMQSQGWNPVYIHRRA